MNWYLYLVDALNIALLFVLLRYQVFRSLYFLQIFQQSGYKINEYSQWLSKKWKIVFPLEIIAAVVWFTGVHTALKTLTTLTARAVFIDVAVLFWLWPVRQYLPENVKKPLVFTNRVWRLTSVLAVISTGLVLLNANRWFADGLLRFDTVSILASLIPVLLLVPFLVLVSGLIIQPVENQIQNQFKRQASAKVKNHPGLKVIAITGSYGKTSTKFFIRDVLKERFNVCSTPGSYNTPMGICKVINEDLLPSHQVLILEMGARYPGNIDELCEIAQPSLSVWTNVGKAHLETFKTVETIAQTKSAIIKHLPAGGNAIINADDPRVVRASMRSDITILTAGLENGKIRARNIEYHAEGCRFLVEVEGGESEIFDMQILGDHTIANMVLAVAVGLAMGMRLKTIAQAAKNIKPVEHRLELKKMGSITVIDDAFNSNPTGAANAIEVLKRFQAGRKILITPGMVELGEEEEKENFQFGRKIGEAGIDKILLVGEKRTEPIRRGILDSAPDHAGIQTVASLAAANDILREYAQPGDVVLYENDLPDIYNEA